MNPYITLNPKPWTLHPVCSSVCQERDWAEHKPNCKEFGAARARALEARVKDFAPGTSSAKNLKRDQAAANNWFTTAPDLSDRVQFLAWKHRAKSPFIMVKTPNTRVDSDPIVVMCPRTQWEDVTSRRQEDVDIKMAVRAYIDAKDFSADNSFIVYLVVESTDSGTEFGTISNLTFGAWMPMVHSSVLRSMAADDFVAEIMRIRTDPEAVYVRLIGLVAAAHLNGREGVLKGQDPNHSERFTVGLQGGREIAVKPQNYELVKRPKVFKEQF